ILHGALCDPYRGHVICTLETEAGFHAASTVRRHARGVRWMPRRLGHYRFASRPKEQLLAYLMSHQNHPASSATLLKGPLLFLCVLCVLCGEFQILGGSRPQWN